ncbi:hypothetical protein KF913_08225 [Candidatus Obscuribacterales bacterium]|nr:hypothetical protein [Candidatus Obscuribacterales bacterium]
MAAEIKSESNEFSSRKILNSSTLILHIPVFYEAASDDPSSIAMNGFTLPGHCAVVYEVVPDPERSGEFMIVCSTRKSLQNAADEAVTSRSRVDDQIIVKGIVGPMDINNPSALPKVFSYVAKNPIHSDRLDLVIDSVLYDQSVANGLAGVAIDLEMKRGNLGSTLTEFPTDKFVAVHSEVCLRLPFADKGRLDPNLYE